LEEIKIKLVTIDSKRRLGSLKVPMSYNDRIQQEIAHYKEVENVHDLPPIFHYWSHNFLRPKVESLGFTGPDDHYIKYIELIATQHPELQCDILSVGSGNADTEVALAESLLQRRIKNFSFTCLDINFHMLERARQRVSEHRLSPQFDFIETDINDWSINRKYQIIVANQSLHHFLELETLFEKIYASLDDKGFFLTNDIIGRNGHMRWPEALRIVNALWSLLEDRHKWNHQLNRFESTYDNWDCSASGFEGIRAQDILPLLLKQFNFHCFLGFANLITPFVDRGFGHNFDIENPRDCYFIDFVGGLDDYFIEAGEIKPTQMIASMTKFNVAPPKVYKHLTPEFCVRAPDVILEKPME